jgi:hypothetical protein
MALPGKIYRTTVPRTARLLPGPRQRIRFQSSIGQAQSGAGGASGSHFGAGVAGGIAGSFALYTVYYFTPSGQASRKFNKVATEAEKKYQVAAKKLQENTPTADQAIGWIKEFAYSYVGWVPGGRAYVDAAFKDFETVRENHREEADKIINDGYKQFQSVAKLGLSLEAASQAYEALEDLAKKIANLAGDAVADILDNHPQLKERLGGNIDQLKEMGEQYGPEAKEKVDETWKEIKDLMARGFSVTTLEKARKLIEEKTEQIKKLGDEAWKKGLDQAEPLFKKNPKIKELVEKNSDALRNGNTKELFDKVKSAVDSGNSESLQDYINTAVEKAKKSVSSAQSNGSWDGITKLLEQNSEGGEMLTKLQQVGEIAEKHKGDGQKLLKETVDELMQVLEKKYQKAQELVEKAKKEAK